MLGHDLRILLFALTTFALTGAAVAQESTEQGGYEWAKRMGIVDPARCGGPSPEFIQGCRRWAMERGLKAGSMPFSTFGSGTLNAGPDFYDNPHYSPPRSNPSSVSVFRRPWGE